MNFFEKKISEIAEESAQKKGFFLIDLIFRGNEKNKVIEVFIDGERNVSADSCAEISRDIISEIDKIPDFTSHYRLEVSTPGVDRPLKLLKQFPKHLGRKFEISFRQNEQITKLNGKLLKIENDELIFLNEKKEEVPVNFSNIIKAKVLISFS
ncbi:MAG TPA: hypothetical protein VLM39_03880 [Ignavibacteriaceae bacterium]|nr:hypothetical protein [Ignavibacteriaceae bacterium]